MGKHHLWARYRKFILLVAKAKKCRTSVLGSLVQIQGKIPFSYVASSVCTFWEEACGATPEGEEKGEKLQFTSRQPR